MSRDGWACAGARGDQRWLLLHGGASGGGVLKAYDVCEVMEGVHNWKVLRDMEGVRIWRVLEIWKTRVWKGFGSLGLWKRLEVVPVSLRIRMSLCL